MDHVTIYPEKEQQKCLLEKMEFCFEVGKSEGQTLLSESVFIAKIDKSIMQVESGQTKKLAKGRQKEFLGLRGIR
jgi:hypothetical protein